MKRMMISVVAAVAAFTAFPHEPDAETVTVYRLQLRKDVQGNETAYIVGADCIERPVVLLDPDEYRLLTNRFEKVWQSFHATADGRRKLHGKIERTEVDEKARKKVEVYADGFRYTEPLSVKNPAYGKIQWYEPNDKKPRFMSAKRWEFEKKRRRSSVPKQVTIERDAVTGKDTVVK